MTAETQATKPRRSTMSREKAVAGPVLSRRTPATPKSVEGSVSSRRVAATLSTAVATGLLQGRKAKQISGRVHETLLEAAAAKSGLRGADLIDYALAKVALEDDFAEQIIALKGSIPKDVDLGA